MSDGCLLVIARSGDPAVELLMRQVPERVAHACVADLSHAGWRYENDRPERATARAGGRIFSASDIAAVVCRIHVITTADLAHIHQDDRDYVASEMNGFLYAWLAQFAGVRFNAPTWTSLAGPHLHELHWTRVVSQLGIPVSAASPDESEIATATVVGNDVFGMTDPALEVTALRIARAVRAGLLSVTFARDHDRWRFRAADPCPALDASSSAALLKRAFRKSESDSGVLCGAA